MCGSWGSGKTSFLRKVWAYLGGDFEPQDATDKQRGEQGKARKTRLDAKRAEWFKEERAIFDKLLKCPDGKSARTVEPLWFNPWEHQFEATPLIALLNEMRQHFTLTRQIINESGKLLDVTIHSVFNSLGDLAKDLRIPLPSAKTVMERGREYEAEHLSTALTSQRFRNFFEKAIETITGDKGLLVIFIDDLDRCEGEVAYRLLESLKLYLNAKNCVFILGLDQQHLERTISKALSAEKEISPGPHRPLAREYLSKMLQGTFHLPVPRQTISYIEKLLNDAEFKERVETLFGITADGFELFRTGLAITLDQNLPHNPRRIKAFVNSWRLYLDALPDPPNEKADKLDWRLTLILQYLAHFEEPLFRKIEQAPAFYSNEFVAFCRSGFSADLLFEGLVRPYEMAQTAQADDKKGGLDDPTPGTSATTATTSDSSKRLPEPRVFWISRLVMAVVNEYGTSLDEQAILRHLLQTDEAQ